MIHLPPAPPRTTRRARAIVATASRFTTAYLRYQIGHDTPSVQRSLRATCTPDFADRLLSQPVSLPNIQRGTPVAHASELEQLTYTGPASLRTGPPIQIVLARYHTIRHPGVGGQLTIEIARTGSSWRVTGLA